MLKVVVFDNFIQRLNNLNSLSDSIVVQKSAFKFSLFEMP